MKSSLPRGRRGGYLQAILIATAACRWLPSTVGAFSSHPSSHIANISSKGSPSFSIVDTFQQQRWQRRRRPSLLAMRSGTTLEDDNQNQPSEQQQQQHEGIRLNKFFKATHSRREADKLIASGRVTVNNVQVESKGGFKVIPFLDKVAVDNELVTGWEEMNAIYSKELRTTQLPGDDDNFEYVKYWKPRGVTCTTDRKIPGNIIDEITLNGYKSKQRVYPVGRLDKDTSGLIVLTSDGRLPNSALRGKYKQPKVYEVFVDQPISPRHVEQLREGIVITTVAQRDGHRADPLVAKTLPCKVEQIDRYGVRIILVEGRNRQIRKMMGALDYAVVDLHRVQFMGISLDPLQGPGDFKALDKEEMRMLQSVIRKANAE